MLDILKINQKSTLLIDCGLPNYIKAYCRFQSANFELLIIKILKRHPNVNSGHLFKC